MEISLTTVVDGAAIAGCVAVIGLIVKQSSALVRIETLLTGADGTNGLVGDVRALKAQHETHGVTINEHDGRLDLHELRLKGIERRSGPTDRRANA